MDSGQKSTEIEIVSINECYFIFTTSWAKNVSVPIRSSDMNVGSSPFSQDSKSLLPAGHLLCLVQESDFLAFWADHSCSLGRLSRKTLQAMRNEFWELNHPNMTKTIS